MPFVIIAHDKPDSFDLRLRVRPEHLAHMDANAHRILGAFAITDDDDTIVTGGVIVLDTEERALAERFVADDPFTQAGLFERVTISHCRKAFFNFQRLI